MKKIRVHVAKSRNESMSLTFTDHSETFRLTRVDSKRSGCSQGYREIRHCTVRYFIPSSSGFLYRRQINSLRPLLVSRNERRKQSSTFVEYRRCDEEIFLLLSRK